MKKMHMILVVLILFLLSGYAAAASTIRKCSGCDDAGCLVRGSKCMCDIVCDIIDQVKFVLETIGPALVVVMFTYGGVKYVFSADDPGGRKAAKNTCIHAIIGGIIILLASWVAGLIGEGCKTCTAA
jgi:hypothetical protein